MEELIVLKEKLIDTIVNLTNNFNNTDEERKKYDTKKVEKKNITQKRKH